MRIKKEKRFRQFMYTQDLDHLKVDDFDKEFKKVNAVEKAYILHDKDIDEDGELIRPHYHATFKFKDAKTISSVAKYFEDEPQYIEIWKGKINNAYSYLLHETTDAMNNPNKHHYNSSEVKANFDFKTKIERIRRSVTLSKDAIKDYISDYASEIITQDELQAKLGVLDFAKNKVIISRITETLEYKKHQQFLKDFKGQQCKVFWLYGKAGVGKTRLAREVFEQKYPNNFCVLGSSKDHFQVYKGEFYIVLNDLRPTDYYYGNLLNLLDPFELDKMAPARYHDKYLNAKAFIITTPYSVENFYDVAKIDDTNIDTVEQLKRRVKEIEVREDNLEEVKSQLLEELKNYDI